MARPAHKLCEQCKTNTYRTKDNLHQSSEAGCHLCTLLLHQTTFTKRRSITFDGHIKKHEHTYGVPQLEVLQSDTRTNDATSIAKPHAATFSCYTGSSDMLDLAKEWLQECRQHSACQSTRWTTDAMPLRLIDVNTGQVVQARGEYAALSYVWDEHPDLEQAMAVTRHLGIPYLWIDKLCIVDFDKECMMMAQIYGNAVCTISGGKFVWRDPLQYLPCKIEEYYGPSVDVIATRTDTVENANISTRGWCFQERLLSRRVLHFTSRGLVWECCTMEATDSNPQGRTLLRDVSDTTRSLRVPLMRLGHTSVAKDLTQAEIDSPFNRAYHATRMRAHQLAQIYSGRQLTNKEDRLAGFQGILAAIATAGLDHVHGIWTGDNAGHQMSLLWHTETADRPLLPRTRGPSWSWTSVDGLVYWHRDRTQDRGYRKIDVVAEAFEGALGLRADRSWQCTKATIISADPLQIRCRPLRMTVKQSVSHGAHLNGSGHDPWVWLDALEDLHSDDVITWLPMLWTDGDDPGVKGLLLKGNRRIGMFVLGSGSLQHRRKWQKMMDVDDETLTLV